MDPLQNKTHWLKILGDYRYEGLVEMFKGFEKALENFNQKVKELSWYDGDIYKDETELIYGVVLVCLQNYINGSCADFIEIKPDSYTKKYQYYSEGTDEISNGVSQIRLIIELANYFKHKDEKERLIKNTKACFEQLDLLKYIEDEGKGWYDDLIFKGLDILCPDWDLNKLLSIAKKWRDYNFERI